MNSREELQKLLDRLEFEKDILAKERDGLRAQVAKLEAANEVLEGNLATWKLRYTSCQTQLHLANDELKKQLHLAGVDVEGVDDVMQRVRETSMAIHRCHEFGMLCDALGMPQVLSPAEAIIGLCDRLSKFEGLERRCTKVTSADENSHKQIVRGES